MQKIVLFFLMIAGNLLASDQDFEMVADIYHLNKSAYLRLFNSRTIDESKIREFSVITIPKSGTHLLAKLLSMLTGRRSHPQAVDIPNQFMLIHFDYIREKQFVLSKKSSRLFINVRDPRDVAISSVFWLWDESNPCLRVDEPAWIDKSFYNAWRKADFDEKLCITLESRTYPFGYIRGNFREAVVLSSRPNAFLTRYENLVGEKGGGSKQVQREAILGIARAINLTSLNREQIAFLQENLYGYSPTFDEGRIGKKRELFKAHHERLLQKCLHEELRYFGY